MNEISANRTFSASDPDWPEKLKAALTEDFGDMDRAERKASGRPPVKNTPEDKAVSERAYGIAAGELRQFIERAEQVEAEIAEKKDDLKEVFTEAKGRGYDTKVMRKVIALRKRDRDDVAEEEAILDMYKAALGMA